MNNCDIFIGNEISYLFLNNLPFNDDLITIQGRLCTLCWFSSSCSSFLSEFYAIAWSKNHSNSFVTFGGFHSETSLDMWWWIEAHRSSTTLESMKNVPVRVTSGYSDMSFDLKRSAPKISKGLFRKRYIEPNSLTNSVRISWIMLSPRK